MCGTSAYNSFLEYAAVSPEIVDILKTHGVKAKVKPTKDKAGFIVTVALPNNILAVLSEEDGEHWSVSLGGEIIELGIPVESRDAKAIAAAVLKVVGK